MILNPFLVTVKVDKYSMFEQKLFRQRIESEGKNNFNLINDQGFQLFGFMENKMHGNYLMNYNH